MCTQRHPAHPDWGPCVSGRPDADHYACQFFGPNPGEQDFWDNPNYVQRDTNTPAVRAQKLKENGRAVGEYKRTLDRVQTQGMDALDLEANVGVRRNANPTEIKAARVALPGSKTKQYGWLMLAAAHGDYGITADDVLYELGHKQNTTWGRRIEVSVIKPNNTMPAHYSGPYLYEDGRERKGREGNTDFGVSVFTEWGRLRMIEAGLLADTEGIVLSELGREECVRLGISLASPATVSTGAPRPMALD